jgi:hypothetical protein
MISAEFRVDSAEAVVDFLRSFEPQFVNRYCENHLKAAVPALLYDREEELIKQVERVSVNLNDTYVKPNFGKHRPILTCCVSEEDGKNQIVFNIPISRAADVNIKVRKDKTILVRWPEPEWKKMAVMLARFVLANNQRGWVLFEGAYRLSLRAGLIVCLLGPDLAAPMIDMAQDGLLEDYPCEESPSPVAFGLKKKSKGTFLEL